MVAYLAFRLTIDAIKPDPKLAGLSALQWACLAGLLYYGAHLPRRFVSVVQEKV
jgi:hypothetical protein